MFQFIHKTENLLLFCLLFERVFLNENCVAFVAMPVLVSEKYGQQTATIYVCEAFVLNLLDCFQKFSKEFFRFQPFHDITTALNDFTSFSSMLQLNNNSP